MLSQRIIKEGDIIQLTCQSKIDGGVYYVIGKKFDKKCIYLVEEHEVENVSNFDNSFFEVQKSQNINNKPNNQSQGEKDNKPIKFGDEIRFKHINSGEYLSVARQYTQRCKGSFKILLEKNDKTEITFQIMPFRTFEKSADPIKYRAKVNIYNQKEQIYLNIQSNSKDQSGQGSQNIDRNYRNQYGKKTKTLIATHIPDSQWQINFTAMTFNPINDVIRDKDLVYMVNSKSIGLLTLAKKQKHKLEEEGRLNKKSNEEKEPYKFVLKQLPTTYPIKKQPKAFDCIWQISLKTQNNVSSNTMGKVGGPELKISFVHLIEQNKGYNNLITKLISSQEGNKIKEYSSKKLHGQTIASGQYIKIGKKQINNDNKGIGDQQIWLGDYSKGNKINDSKHHRKMQNKVYKELSEIKNSGQSIVFQIVKIPEDLKKQIYSYIQAKQIIQSFINSISQNNNKKYYGEQESQRLKQAKQQEEERFKQTTSTLNHIIKSLDPNPAINTAAKILQIQMILNDIGFINIVMLCLQKLTQKDIRDGGRSQQSISLRKEFHNVLKQACTGNEYIKLALSNEQNLLQLLKPSNMDSNQFNDIDTLKQIMKDNKYAIEHVMNQKVVKSIIHEFENKSMQIQVFIKYIQILRLICKTSDEVIPRNQKLIIEQLLERRKRQGQLNNSYQSSQSPTNKKVVKKNSNQKDSPSSGIDFFFCLNQDKQVNIITPKTKLGDNKVISQANQPTHYFFTNKDHPEQRNACIQWIGLISDVCQSKNVQGKKFAEERFGPRVIQTMISLPKVSSNLTTALFGKEKTEQLNKNDVQYILIGPIVRLLNNAYIKTIYRQKIFFDRIYIAKPISQNYQNNINELYPKKEKIHQESDFLQKIKIFISRYIYAAVEAQTFSKDSLIKDNQTLLQAELKLIQTTKNVFMLMKNMIMYGLYNPSQDYHIDRPPYRINSYFNEPGKGSQIINIYEDIRSYIKKQRGFMFDFLNILSKTNSNSSFKSQILQIINFYMNLDLRQRVNKTIGDIKLKLTQQKKQVFNSKLTHQQLRQQKNKKMRDSCYQIMQKYKPSKITQEQIRLFIIIMLGSIKNDNVKNKSNFILSLNTLSKFIQVNRIFTIRVKQTLIIKQEDFDQNDKLNTLKKARDKFQVCEIKDLKGISFRDQYQLNVPIWDKKGDSIIRFILKITNMMKDGDVDNINDKEDSIYSKACNSQYLLSAYNQLQKPNPKIQKMVRQMKLHRYFFSFIKQMNNQVKEELSKKLLQIVYLCLAVFTWKNYQNKIELSQLFTKMLEHAQYNNGSIQALKQFFSQNPSILYDQEKITRVTQKITNYIDNKTSQSICTLEYQQNNYSTYKKLNYNFYYAAKLLDFLHSLIVADSSKQGRNRILVLSYILDKDRLKITKPDIIEKIRIGKDLKSVYDAQVTYLSVLFGLLAQLVDGESINIAKCKKLHKLQVLIEIMSNMKNNIRLKASARDYVNKLYYASMDNSYIELILTSQLDTFIFDLNQYVYYRIIGLGNKQKYYTKDMRKKEQKNQNKIKQQKQLVEIVYAGFKKMDSKNRIHNYQKWGKPQNFYDEKNPIRYSYKSTYFYLNLERVVDSLDLIFVVSKKTEEQMKKLSSDITKKLVELYKKLRFIYINFFFDDKPFKTKIRNILHNIQIKFFNSDTQFKKPLSTDLRVYIYKKSNDKESYEIKYVQPILTQQQKNDRNQQKDQSPKQDMQKIKMQNYMSINKIMQVILKSKDNNKNKQESSEDIYKNIISSLGQDTIVSDSDDESQNEDTQSIDNNNNNSIDSLYQIYMHTLITQRRSSQNNKLRQPNIEDLGRELVDGAIADARIEQDPEQIKKNMKNRKDKRNKEKQQKNNKQKMKNIQNEQEWLQKYKLDLKPKIQEQLVSVFSSINVMIAQNYQIFQAKNLTFYFRTVLKEIKKLSADCWKKLTDTFSQLMYRTITSCNLQQNIQVSYWFFEFVAQYWDNIKLSKTQPQKLFKLIQQDYKNLFLIKLNDFIVFLSNDIDRKVKHPLISRESPLKIFNIETQSFVAVENTQFSESSKQIYDKRILKTFKNIFQFMQLLCENNFVSFKSEFRQQKIQKVIKPNNRNLLIRSTIQLRKLLKMYTIMIVDLPQKILDFINEIAQIPCYDNQIELSKSNFFQDICQFIFQINLRLGLDKDHQQYKKLQESEKFKKHELAEVFQHVQNIIERFFKILLSLLESNMDEIYQSLLQKLSDDFFDLVMKIHQNNPKTPSIEQNPNSKIGKLKINMLIIRKQLDIKSLKDSKLLQNLKKLTEKNSKSRYSIENIQSIEVRLEKNQHKLYFFKPEEAEGINKDNQFIQSIEEKLDRSTHLQKLDSLLVQRKNIQMYMVYQHNSRKGKYHIIHQFIPLSNYASALSFLINVIIMATTSINIIGENVNSQEYYRILLPFQIVQFILGTLFFFADAWNHIMKSKFDKYNLIEKQLKGKPQYKFSNLDFSGWRSVIKGIIPSIIYYLFCILGLFVSPYYYSIHILFIISKIKVLENVFKAITYNIYQLVYLALLGIAFFIVFSILSIDTYAPYAEQQYCNSIWQCFLVIYNKDLFIQQSQNTETNFTSLLYEILYSVFFGALFGNIISGLMTDTFAQLRDKQNYISQDEDNFCYICGRSRFQIERENKDKLKLAQIYQKHIMKHNKLSYVFYLYQLQKKQKTQYTGLEYIISKRVEQNSVVWFPIKKKQENEDITEIKKQLKALEKML